MAELLKRNLNIDDVRQYHRKMVNSLTQQVYGCLLENGRRYKLETLLDSRNILDQSAEQKISWLTLAMCNPVMASTPQRMQHRTLLMQQLCHEYGVSPSQLTPENLHWLHVELRKRLPEDERREQQDTIAALMQALGVLRAKIFLLEPDLLKAVSDAQLGDYDHQPMFPYPDVWVEPAQRMSNPLDSSELLVGASMSRPAMDEVLRQKAEAQATRELAQLPYKLRQACEAARDWMEYHSVYSRQSPSSPLLSHWEYFGSRDCKGYDSAGVINGQTVAETAPCKPTKLTVRLLSYLVSSNVEYVLVQRPVPAGAGKRLSQRLQSPYYVTRVRKTYVHGLTDQPMPGTGTHYGFRFSVAGHWFHRWYCSACNKAHAIARVLAGNVCVRCGIPLTREATVVRTFWQPPHEKGPDVAAQTARQAYSVVGAPGAIVDV